MKRYKNLLKTETIYTKMPMGWSVIKEALTAPIGYVLICNQESHFNGKRKQALLKL